MAKIHICEDNIVNLELFVKILEIEGHTIETSQTGKECLNKLTHSVDVLLLDVHLPDIMGLEVLKLTRKLFPSLKVILITADADESLLELAYKNGAFNYLNKPLASKKITVAISEALQKDLLSEEIRLESESPLMINIMNQIKLIASTGASVIIGGQSGTGKEVFARYIHNKSAQKDGPFVVVNCPAIPDNLAESELFGHKKGAFTGATDNRIGKIEAANTGTLFLDEVADLTLNLQAKILRVLQDKTIQVLGSNQDTPVKFRVICATHKDLKEEINQGRFRLDLYYRLAEFEMNLPSLYERKEDIPALSAFFVNQVCKEEGKPPLTFSPNLITTMINYKWPGNIRELRSVVRRLVILNPAESSVLNSSSNEFFNIFEEKTLPVKFKQLKVSTSKNLHEIEQEAIIEAMKDEKNNMSAVAKRLGIGRTTLYRKLKTYRISSHRNQIPLLDNENKVGLIDDDVVTQMKKSLGNDSSLMNEIIEKFIIQNDLHMERMMNAANDQDYESLNRIAHSLKGSAQTCGARAIEQISRELEVIDKTTPLNILFTKMNELQRQIDFFKNHIQKKII